MRKVVSIQILRAVAALGVVLFHACQWSHIDFAVGAAGVDLFFVISGFVLWGVGSDDPPGRFLLARLARVAPLYWLVTIVVFLIARRWPDVLPIVHPDVRHLILSLGFLPHIGPGGDPFPLLPTGWTLTYEAFFYAVFAIALLCPRDRRLQVLSLGMFTASILGFGYHGWYTVLCNPLLLEFLGGVWLARLWAKGRLRAQSPVRGAALIGLGVAILAACQASGLRDDFLRPFVWAPPAMAIAGGALVLDSRIRQGAAVRALSLLGDSSYSLYLVNAPLIAAFAWATPTLNPLIRAPLAVLLAVAGGLICWRWVERPLGLAGRGLHHRPVADGRLRRGLRTAEQEPLAHVDADLA